MLTKILRRPTAATSAHASTRLAYLPGLDGLRALAVIAVLLYHADVLWLPGGFLGVEIFFVVSGYLITSLLLAEYRQDNKIELKKFWQRRARRLLPALFAMLIAVMVYAAIFLPDELAALRMDVLAAFTYVTNWYLIVAQKSYFETIGRPSLLRHLWSLAVEEQFYLLWPLIFAFILTRLKTRAALLVLMLGAAASALLMGFLYPPDADPSRVYYGTDTRAAGLLIGAALAFVWTPRADANISSRAKRWLLDGLGIAALAGLVAACLLLSEFDPFLYQGGLLLVAGATAFVIAAVVNPASPILSSILGFGVLRWIGLRSYGLYLWHWPVFMLTRPQLDTTLDGTPLLLFRFGLSFLLAEISYRIVETPIRKGALGKMWDAWNSAQGKRRWGMGLAWAGIVAIFALGALTLGTVLITAQPAAEPDLILMTPEDEGVSYELSLNSQQAENSTTLNEATSSDMLSVSFASDENGEIEYPMIPLGMSRASWERVTWFSPLPQAMPLSYFHLNRPAVAFAAIAEMRKHEPVCTAQCQSRYEELVMRETGVQTPRPPTNSSPQLRITLSSLLANATSPATPQLSPLAQPVQPPTGPAQVLALGDSVMLGASNYLRKTVAAMDVDAKLGRQVSAALNILRQRKEANALTPVVIVHLGNNGTFSAKQFDEMMTLLQDVPRVIFLTNKVPRKWQEPNNNALVAGVKKYPNAVLVDWNALSSSHPEWFWKDGIHLRPEGAKVYANLIAVSLQQAAP